MTLLDPTRTSFSRRDHFLLASVTFIVASIAFVLYRAFVPETVLTISVNPLPARLEWLRGATTQTLVYQLSYCKKIDAPSTVLRELRSVNGNTVVSLYTSGYSLPIGCDTVDIVEPMPSYIPPGRYILRVTFTYRVNAVASPLTFETVPFDLE